MSRDLLMTKSYIFNKITPAAFMQFEPEQTAKEEELLEAVKGFSNEQMDRLIRIAKTI